MTVINVAAIVLVALVGLSQADKACRTECSGKGPGLLKYPDGSAYKYKLNGKVEIALSGADNQNTEVQVTADVIVKQLTGCQQVIQLQNVQEIGPDKKKINAGGDLEKPVRFLNQGGEINDQICAEPGDSQNSLNVKRAVISLLQASTEKSREIDVFGDCPTTMSKTNEGDKVVIHKTRDLNRCAHRESVRHSFIASNVDENSGIKTTSLLDSQFTSIQKIKGGILESAEVKEQYLYKPFSYGQNGARSHVVTTLTLIGKVDANPAVKVSIPKTILFENPHINPNAASNVNSLETEFRSVYAKCVGKNRLEEKCAGQFIDFIKLVRVSSHNDLLNVYSRAKAGSLGNPNLPESRRLFLDALYQCGTGECIETSISLINNREIQPDEFKTVFVSMAFVKHATSNSLKAVANLLESQKDLPRSAYLSTGILVNRFCREHNCEKDQNLMKLTNTLIGKLGACQASTRKEETQLISVLKALGNYHYIHESYAPQIIACASNDKIATRVRVAALETLATDSGKPKVKQAVLTILKNTNEEPEIRIKAYLAAVASACPDVANALRSLLETEPVNQVGSFIVSHLRNIRSSANPDKDQAKQHLSLLRSPKRFPIDIRRFSFNSELSYALDVLGSAASAETNVIYSPNSWLPRSVSLNLTSEVFGHAVNFLEVSARQENLDKVLERIIGPRNVFKKMKYAKNYDDVKSIFDHIKQRLDKAGRGKRDINDNELKQLAESIHVVKNKLDNDMDLDLSVKLFGSELLALTLTEELEKLSPTAIVDKVFDALENKVDELKNFDRKISPHILILDTQIAYPTSIGLPLKLTALGSAVVQIQSSGKIDIRSILKDPSNAHIALRIVPSANVEVSGSLTIDAHQVETGLFVTTNVYSSTGSDVTVKLLNSGKGIDVQIKLPHEKQDIINVDHKLSYITKELGKPSVQKEIKFTGQRKEHHGCFDQLQEITGLTACVEFAVPLNALPGVPLGGVNANASPFPLSGPVKIKAHIERESSSSTYHLKALYSDENPHSRKIELLFDTPNSKTNRKVSLVIEGQRKPELFVRATLVSPIKNGVIEGRITDNDKEHSASAKLSFDDQEYAAKLGVSVSGTDAKAIYKPLFELKAPDNIKAEIAKHLVVEGSVIVEKTPTSRIYTFDKVKLINKEDTQATISVEGKVGKDGGKYFADLDLAHNDKKSKVKGSITLANGDSIAIEGELTNPINPAANVKFSTYHKLTKNSFENRIAGAYGDKLQNKMELINDGKYNVKSLYDFDVSTNNKFSCGVSGVSGKANAHLTCHSAKVDIEGTYKDQKFSAKWDSHLDRTTGAYKLVGNLDAFKNQLSASASRTVASPTKSKFENKLVIKDKVFEVNADVNHLIKPNDVNLEITSVAKLSGLPNDIKVHVLVARNAKEMQTALKLENGPQLLIDGHLQAAQATAKGHLKAHIQDVVDVDGLLASDKGKGSAHLLVSLIKLNRKIKGETTFTINLPTANVLATLYLDFEKSPNSKISVNTENQIDLKKSLSTKTKVIVFDQVTEIIASGKLDGNAEKNTFKGEGSLQLPCGFVVSGSVHRDAARQNGNLNAKVDFNGEVRTTKDAAPRSLSVTVVSKDINLSKHSFDYTIDSKYTDENKKNLVSSLQLKHHDSGDAHNNKYSAKTSGSLIDTTVDVSGETTVSATHAAYQHQGKVNSYEYKVDGKYDLGKGLQDKKSYQANGEIKTPIDTVKLVKWQVDGSNAISKEKKTAEVHGKGSLTVNDKTTKGDISVNSSPTHSDIKLTATLPNGNPASLSVSVKRDGKTEAFSANVNVDITNNGKVSKVSATVNHPNKKEITIKINGVGHTDAEHKVDASITGKIQGNDNYIGEASVSVDGKTHTLNAKVIPSKLHPYLNIEVVNPEKQKGQVLLDLDRSGAPKYKLHLILASMQGDHLDVDSTALLDTSENFDVTIKLNSNKADLKDVVLKISNKEAKSGSKNLHVAATQGGKNLIDGSTSYNSKIENGKLIVEGSGKLKVKEDTKKADFKFIKKNLIEAENGEEGVEGKLTANVGSHKIVGEVTISDKQLYFSTDFCEDKKCAVIKLKSKTVAKDIDHFKHELKVDFDLIKVGWSKALGVNSEYERNVLDVKYELEIYVQPKDKAKQEFKYKVKAAPSSATLEVTIPSRQVVVEANSKHSDNSGVHSQESTVVIFADKKHRPNDKTVITTSLQISDNDVSGKALVSNKQVLGKDYSVSGKANLNRAKRTVSYTGEIDLFAKPEQKIIITGSASGTPLGEKGYRLTKDFKMESTGQNILITSKQHFSVSADNGIDIGSKSDYKFGKCSGHTEHLFMADTRKIEFVAKKNGRLAHFVSLITHGKDFANVITELSVDGIEPIVYEAELKMGKSLVIKAFKKNNPSQSLTMEAQFIVDKKAEITVLHNKKEILTAGVQLDDAAFLKPKYSYSDANAKELLEKTKAHMKANLQQLRDLSVKSREETVKELKCLQEVIVAATPNLTPIFAEAKKELKRLLDELESDLHLKPVIEAARKLIHQVADLLLKVHNHLEEFAKAIRGSLNQIRELIADKVIPEIKAAIKKIAEPIEKLANSVAQAVFLAVAQVQEILKAHEAEFKKIAEQLRELNSEATKFISQVAENIRQSLSAFVKELIEQIKALPAAEILKNQLSGMPSILPANLGELIEELTITLKEVAPTPEIQRLIEDVGSYLAIKVTNVNNDKINDAEELAQIYKDVVEVIRMIYNKFQGVRDSQGVRNIFSDLIPTSFEAITRIPKILLIRISPLRWIMSDDLPSILDLIYTYRVKLNPLENFPPFTYHAAIVNGRHFFTFDGHHFTADGQCSYVLVQDGLDRNFSLVAEVANKQLKSLSLHDLDGNVMTLHRDQKLTKNGQAVEYPIYKKSPVAYRTFDSVHMVSRGLRVDCVEDLEVCTITLTGFYKNRVRGLFGNANDEQYDELILPSGQIAKTENDLLNAYAKKGCAAPKVIEHKHNHGNSKCASTFASNSHLSLCYRAINPDNFREACEHADGNELEQCNIALTYTYACLQSGILVAPPKECVKCKVDGTHLDIGEVLKVEAAFPAKQADIIIAIEEFKYNENILNEFIVPLVTKLTADLKAKGVTDIQFGLIGFNDFPYPKIYSNDGKINYHGKPVQLDIAEDTDELKVKIGVPSVDNFLKTLKKISRIVKNELGISPAYLTADAILDYPFRPRASHTVLTIQANSCNKYNFNFGLSTLRSIKYLIEYQIQDISFNVITPADGLKSQPDVIGYTDSTLLTLDNKGKKLDDAAEKEIDENVHDRCADFSNMNDGAAFFGNVLKSSDAGKKSQFVNAVSHQLTEQLTSLRVPRTCTCIPKYGVLPQVKCTTTTLESIKNGIIELAS